MKNEDQTEVPEEEIERIDALLSYVAEIMSDRLETKVKLDTMVIGYTDGSIHMNIHVEAEALIDQENLH